MVVWRALEPTWQLPVFARPNYRQRAVPTAGGVAAVAGVLVVTAGAAVLGDHGLGAELAAPLVAMLGFGLLGAIDDLAGDDTRKGFRGHVAAMAHGQLTTGGLKLVGGVAVAAAAVGLLGERAAAVDVVVVAAAANLGNLFDRAPGRVAKVATVSLGALALSGLAGLAGVALAVGAVAGLAPFDLRERLMLGDTGANAVGAALGVGLVLRTDVGAAAVTAAVLVALNLASEFISFSRVIAAVPPLRWLDGLGRVKVVA